MHSDNEMVNLRSVIETLLYMVDEDSDGVEEVMQLPTIELVRCKECKHWDDRRDDDWWSEDGACMKTTRLGYATYRKANDYCSYGERKESE